MLRFVIFAKADRGSMFRDYWMRLVDGFGDVLAGDSTVQYVWYCTVKIGALAHCCHINILQNLSDFKDILLF